MEAELSVNVGVRVGELHHQIVELRDQAVGCAARAGWLAVECGQLLIDQKTRTGQGDWLLGLQSYCPAITESTAQRYMQIANHATLLSEAGLDFQTLKELYVALGIMPAPPVAVPQTGEKLPVWVKLTTRFDALIPKLTTPQKVELRAWLLAVLERL